ncbi:MAG: TetR/AcrR family transcriptional regulator [Dehalococcoidia bacterium]
MNDSQRSGRKPLTRALVVEQALSLADAHGLDAVTIRRLAKDLGVTPMALYWHFRNKDQLLDGMVDRIYAGLDGTVDDAASWQEQFRSLLNQLIAVLRAHPAAAMLLQMRDTYSERSLRVNETALDILRRAGLSPFEAARVMRHAVAMAAGVATDAATLARREPATGMHDAARRAPDIATAQPAQHYPIEAARVLRQQEEADHDAPALSATQSRERYPRIVEAATAMRWHEDADAYCVFGVDLLLAGIEAIAARGGRDSGGPGGCSTGAGQ